MSDKNLERARDIYLSLLDLDSPSDRIAFIDRECHGDDELKSAIESLLVAQEADPDFLEEPFDGLLADRESPDVAATIDVPHQFEQLGTRLGPYKLLQQIGEGGFGVVYMAEQTKPVRRKVALKIIKPGMDSRDVVARFEAERQTLALMNHPNVANVFDSGTTDSGRPYIVMELVHGVPITSFCDDNKLPTQERLKLFVDLCWAVQHAHQKGIIHRDLKPSNILVAMDGDRPLAKVIDFGVSKALSQQLTEKTLFTAYGQMVGTPLYMSPEQAQFSAKDIDTRSDVYSLGVLLYELLTGHTPFDRSTLQESGLDEMRRLIREVDPPRPSARVSTLQAEVMSTVADQRGVDHWKMSKLISGELDWITMRCLEKDRSRRYHTAAELAKDINAFLQNEPVQACPPSAGYRLRKFGVWTRFYVLIFEKRTPSVML